MYVDEAHVVAGPALSRLFSQARKFNCSVTVACQTPSQLEPYLDEILTSTQTHLLGRLSQREALRLGDRVGEEGVRALTRLPRHHLLLGLEESDPDLPPMILTPVPPPKVSAVPTGRAPGRDGSGVGARPSVDEEGSAQPALPAFEDAFDAPVPGRLSRCSAQ